MDIILTPEQAVFTLHSELGKHAFESGVTRKVLTATPEAKRDYKPDSNSRSAIEIAYHIAASEEWFLRSMLKSSFDWGGEALPEGATFASIADHYDKTIPGLVAEVKALSTDKLTAPLSFFGMFNNSAVTYLRFMNDHSIHHRGQLSAYVRAAGGKVPSIYGGSYDEPMMG
jgi:uncharacterized damage-inducible protein DinB